MSWISGDTVTVLARSYWFCTYDKIALTYGEKTVVNICLTGHSNLCTFFVAVHNCIQTNGFELIIIDLLE